jgi:hypothetical protein
MLAFSFRWSDRSLTPEPQMHARRRLSVAMGTVQWLTVVCEAGEIGCSKAPFYVHCVCAKTNSWLREFQPNTNDL